MQVPSIGTKVESYCLVPPLVGLELALGPDVLITLATVFGFYIGDALVICVFPFCITSDTLKDIMESMKNWKHYGNIGNENDFQFMSHNFHT